MEELYRLVSKGEQCVSWQVFQAAVKECQSTRDGGGGGAEEMATAVGGPTVVRGGAAELQRLECGPSTTSSDVGMSSSKETRGVEVALENKELWKQFSKITNEMIVTKAGRLVELITMY